MKKLSLLLLSALFLFPLGTKAQTLPEGADLSFKVINISQDNKDAEAVGVRPGDVLRYEVQIESKTENVSDYIARVDVSNIAAHVEFVDLGLGSLENGWIVYPSYSHEAPCQQTFTFFVRFKECEAGMTQLSATLDSLDTLVPTVCSGNTPKTISKLPSSGPGVWLAFGIIAFFTLMGLGNLAFRE